jgi:hypothetical protein
MLGARGPRTTHTERVAPPRGGARGVSQTRRWRDARPSRSARSALRPARGASVRPLAAACTPGDRVLGQQRQQRTKGACRTHVKKRLQRVPSFEGSVSPGFKGTHINFISTISYSSRRVERAYARKQPSSDRRVVRAGAREWRPSCIVIFVEGGAPGSN